MLDFLNEPLDNNEKKGCATNLIVGALFFSAPTILTLQVREYIYENQLTILWCYSIFLIIVTLIYMFKSKNPPQSEPSILSIDIALEKIIEALQDDSLKSVFFYDKYKKSSLTVIDRNINQSEYVITLNGLENSKHRLVPQILEYAVYNQLQQLTATAECIQRVPEWKIKIKNPVDQNIFNANSNEDLNVHFINPNLEIDSSIVHELINEIKKLGK